MRILYVLIRFEEGNTFLEISKVQGNHRIISEDVLKEVSSPGYYSVDANNGLFMHFLKKNNGPTFLCITSKIEAFIAQNFILELEKEYYKRKELNKEKFTEFVEQRIIEYNSGEAISKADEELDKIAKIAIVNINEIMKRGDNITLLMKKTEEMGDISLTNFNKTKELKKKMDWEELKTKLIYVVAVLCLIYLVLAFFCGVFLVSCFA